MTPFRVKIEKLRFAVGVAFAERVEYARLCADRLKQLSLFAVQAGGG